MRLVQERGAGTAIGHAFLDEQFVGFANPGSLRGRDRTVDVAAELDLLASSHLEPIYKRMCGTCGVVAGPQVDTPEWKESVERMMGPDGP